MNNLKDYLVFFGDVYYPNEGWLDFDSSFSTREEAKKHLEEIIKEDVYMWGQVTYIGVPKEGEIHIECYGIFNEKGEWSEPI